MKQAGLVKNERKGYWIPYSIDEEALENCRSILNKVCNCGCKGSLKFKELELKKNDLASLLVYERELYQELQNIRKRISEIEAGYK